MQAKTIISFLIIRKNNLHLIFSKSFVQTIVFLKATVTKTFPKLRTF